MPYPRDIRIIDTLLDLPREDRAAKERFANLRDADSVAGKGGHPAGYLFKDTPEARTPGADPVGDTLRAMDQFGIETAVFNLTKDGWTDTEAYAARTHPTRFRPVLQVDPNTGMDAVRATSRAHAELGIVGVTLFPVGYVPPVPINDKRMYPLYAKCVELDVPVSVQVGHVLEAMPSDCGRPIYLDRVACDFPELRILASHTGWPWVEELISVCYKWDNVWFGVDAWMPKYLSPPILQFVNSRMGADRCVWGTNGLPWAENLRQLDDLGLREDSKRKLLRDNAIELFKL